MNNEQNTAQLTDEVSLENQRDIIWVKIKNKVDKMKDEYSHLQKKPASYFHDVNILMGLRTQWEDINHAIRTSK